MDVFLQVEGLHDFEWLKNARYYWEIDEDTLVVRMSNSKYFYAYEYLGASARLVITPLTVSLSNWSGGLVSINLCVHSVGSLLPLFDGCPPVGLRRSTSRPCWYWQD